ncbi:O-acetylhomoserine sulfhydrylase / O-succinylhomoserine sulfhydrylase [Candidatus Pelagibacter sp. IMCC9063]|uniref:O-acetylhomoserine aminocarboxypropyltransferase/cysteine synthase family protein n=1 Tax=Pelagibacter sp. (strain IMCC9063) TaxID=1002672 RepID=UPI0002046669|nr:PLP-dependent transferase [Candidatus Pelagibacter sp. IMCC9063]AEA80746.1 O-acetylhomoserine sulfhydrylase / O-succinylhomoserine sulfhydrylase [Candidatus Pelagibacter sp. IMCC9063]
MTTTSKHPETISLHGGTYRRDESTTAVAVPIYQTTSYQFNSAEHAENLFGLKEFGNIYTRIGNPTTNVLEERVAALEGGVAAVCVSSGQAASAFVVQNLCSTGDNIVASTDLYGGTVNLFNNTLKSMGIEVRYADPKDPESFAKATDKKTRLYYAETLPNPSLRVFPIKEVSDIGRKLGIPLVMDNTACPVICKPIDHGAAIVMHSLTKFIGGHGTTIGGIIVDAGNFDWSIDKERQPNIWQPDASYHGAVWGDAVPVLTGANIPYIIRARVVLLRDLGSAISPTSAWQIIQGLETVTLRMKQHCENAEKVKNFLLKHKKIEKVIYSTLHEGEIGERTKKYFKGGNGALMGIEVKGGKEAGKKFIDSLKLLYHVANIGDARSLAIHPASTTHSQLSEKDLLAAGVTPGYVRLSIGIEHADDIIADIDQALNA